MKGPRRAVGLLKTAEAGLGERTRSGAPRGSLVLRAVEAAMKGDNRRPKDAVAGQTGAEDRFQAPVVGAAWGRL